MPALDATSSIAWLKVNEPALATIISRTRAAEPAPRVARALDDLGRALHAALARDASQLSIRLRDASTSRDLAALLAELDPARQHHLFHWLAGSALADHRTFLAAVLDGTTGGPRLRAGLLSLNRHALLARLFSPERVQALLTAHKTTKET